MRSVAFLIAPILLVAFGEWSTAARAEAPIRLAQSSTVTNCMMGCNAQAASCRTACVVPGAAPSNAATATSNATASTGCLLTCGTSQVSCQTNCSLQSPSQ